MKVRHLCYYSEDTDRTTAPVLRALLKRTKVLHRDISARNILMYPEHHPDTEQEVVSDPPKFILDVLG